jgi:nucleoside-diphosphate-sugar epimerase
MKKNFRLTASIAKAGFFSAALLFISPQFARANPELDRLYALETIGILRSWDNVDGLFSEYVTTAYKDWFTKQSRFTLQDLSKADVLLANSKIPSARHHPRGARPMNLDIRGRKVAIIGGAGFIGHNLAVSLHRMGAQVEVVDSLQVNNLLAFTSGGAEMVNRSLYVRMINQRLDMLRLAGIPLHIQDARDYHALSRILSQIKPQVIVHLAAVAHANRSNKDPFSTFDHSLRTLENALDWARDCTGHFIFFSSSMAYGNFQTPEVDEEHPLSPIGIYGALKVAGERIVIAYQQVFGLPYTIIRPSALYGPGCVSRRVGQVFIESALKGTKLRVDGDGAERLDFTYIDDLVDGICIAIENPAARNQVFNMTYGSSRSIQDLVAIVKKYFPDVEVERVERDNFMPFRGTLGVAKAVRLLGYETKNPIAVGFPRYIEWYKELVKDRTMQTGRAA